MAVALAVAVAVAGRASAVAVAVADSVGLTGGKLHLLVEMMYSIDSSCCFADC